MKTRARLAILFILHSLIAVAQGCHNSPWMSFISDSRTVASLSIPGAHDAATGEGMYIIAGFGKTQVLDISSLWECGVRAFDLRPAMDNGKLHIYHGPVKTKISFQEALEIISAKLEQQPSEFAIVLLRNEGKACDEWKEAIGKAIAALNDKAAMFSPTMKMADVRGKILFLSRDEYSGCNRGAMIKGWSHSHDGTTNAEIVPYNNGTAAHLNVQDYYDTTGKNGLELKSNAATRFIELAGSAPDGCWTINFLSAYRTTWLGFTPFATSAGYKRNASVVNREIAEMLAQRTADNKKATGIIFIDYAGVDKAPGGIWHWREFHTHGKQLVQIIIEQNFR